jgi:crotonobetainyl-CoA:carnitine CoA-transferase CaiB-like acyl-CoA transferase
MLIEVPRPDADTAMLVVGNPVKMSRVAEGPVGPTPRLGEHTDEVLTTTLGLRADELAALRSKGVID